jgi:hypothetical protein
MSRAARVVSIDVIQRMTVALGIFAEEADQALTDVEIEVRRAAQWVRVERREFWNHQLRIRQEQVTAARINLERARMFTGMEGERKSCVDEMKALEKARRRLAVAEEKVAAVKRWTQVVDHEVLEFEGCLAALTAWLQTEYPKGSAALGRMSRALEEYVQIESKVEGPPPLNLAAFLDAPPQSDASAAPAEPPAETAPEAAVEDPGNEAKGGPA